MDVKFFFYAVNQPPNFKENTDGRLVKATVVYAPARGQDHFSFIKLLF